MSVDRRKLWWTHPERCAGCRGTGWTDGPPIIETINGQPHPYPTLRPCTHPWHHDDTGWDPYYDEPAPCSHPRADTAYNQGYTQGLADIDQLKSPKDTP